MTEADVVSFSLSAGELTVRDEAGGGKLAIEIDGTSSLTPATDAWFDVPVDSAVSLETASMEFRRASSAQVRDVDGEYYGTVTDQEFSIAGGTYLDISAAMKLLVYVEGPTMTGRLVGESHNPQSLRVAFDEPTDVIIGARSYHEEPAATMTVTDDPEDLMAAASYLGSSIKEWSAERSWPTLRGHPPTIELGEERRLPDRLSKPDTDMTVGVPRETAAVLRVMPLAHYFGADVVPADRAELRLGSQHVEPLGSGVELERSVDDLLAHALVLDSLVRIGGYYSMARYEYDELAPELPFYPPELYDEPIHRQLLEYLEVPFETVAPYVPEWPSVGTLRPTAGDVEAVPYLLNTLSRIHVTQDGVPRRRPSTLERPVHLSTNRTVPRHVAALPGRARERASSHERQPSGDTSVLFVGDEFSERRAFEGVEWDRFELGGTPSATSRASVTREELRSLLVEPYTHVHYGNDVTSEGFVCSDGILPFEALPDGDLGSIAFEWPRPSTAALDGVLDTASVACLLAEPVSARSAQQFAVYLLVGHSVATSARHARIEDARFLGDATLSVARRQAGHPPLVYQIDRVGSDEYRVLVELDTDEHDLLGRIAGARFEQSSDQYQLAGTRERTPQTLAMAELGDLLTGDSIVRLNWCPDSVNTPTPPELDELLPK